MPEQLRMPSLSDFQLFPGRERLKQLRDVERRRFLALTDTPEKKRALLKDDDALATLVLLDADDAEEGTPTVSRFSGLAPPLPAVRGVVGHGMTARVSECVWEEPWRSNKVQRAILRMVLSISRLRNRPQNKWKR